MRSDRERLLDILESIKGIERYASEGRTVLEASELVQTWIVYHMQIIGEAVGRLSPEVRAANDDIPWAGIIGTRNVLVHDYFGIDLDRLWVAVELLPALKARVQEILAEQ